jgi:hypothetical protein
VPRPFGNVSGESVLNRRSSSLAPTLDALVFCALLVLTYLLACFPNQDMDIWWHLKAGRAILQGQGIPTRDTYTIAAAGHEWIDLHWLYQVAVAYLHEMGGMEAITLAAASVAVLAMAAGVLACSSRAIAPFIPILWFPALLVMSSRFLVRPEILSLACLAGYLWVLHRAESRPAILWLLVPIQIFWVNVQGLFIYGPFLLVCWLIDRWVHAVPEKRSRFRAETAAPTIAVLLACLANPYGWRGAVYPLELARTMFIDGSFYRNHIGELASPLTVWEATAYRDVYVWAAGLLFAMTASSFLASGVRIRAFRVMVFAVFSGLALTAVRNLPQYALVAACIQTWNMAERPSQTEHARRYGFAFRIVSLATVIILVGSLVTGRFYPMIGSSRILSPKELPLWHGHDAAQFAAREGMPEQIVAYHEGQAALVEFHMRDEQRVYVDSRLEVMTRPAMENYYRLADSIWRGDEIRRQMLPVPTTILVDHASHFALEPTLLSDPDWTCAWFGPVAAVYVPKAADVAPRDPSGDLAARHFGGTKFERTNSARMQGLRGGLDADLLEASALLNIAQAAGERATKEGTDRRVLLLLAARIARDSIDRLPQAACRIGAVAAFRMYAAPTTPPVDWQILESIGLARARYLLRRCQDLQSNDFATLAEEYTVVSALGDPDAIYDAARRLSAAKAQTAQQSRMQALVKRNLNANYFRSTIGTDTLVDPESTADEQVRELFESRRFLRIRARFAVEPSDGIAAAPAFESSRDLVALSCLLCGDPQSARTVWRRASGGDDDSRISLGVGMTHMAEQDHASAARQFEVAIRQDASNVDAHCARAVCHLELGSASAAVEECDLALDVPEITEGMRQFCERMRDFAKRHVREGDRIPDTPR